ncbi:hypothetical protein ILUMI_25536 [Ignelater luminosus]|uniref:HSac2 domain-containing protein n=1 Tax=Ignelater luminosus TaxID=2038154 RepID=A0A8K0CAC3_IGNLU|nr:hypothetical protein ILUMI_25536 [Ignelater luminosus]
MMELEDIDDLPQEFKGGTLEINSDDLKTSNSKTKLYDPVKPEEENINCSNNNKNRWNNVLISPFVSIPQRITETIRNKKPEQNNVTSLEPIPAVISTETASDYFTFREGIVEQAVKECVEQFLDAEADGTVWAAYLLTEISLWDADKERLILITPKTLVIIKYDFIAMRRLEYKKLPLECVDTVMIGNLVYPSASIIPNRNMRGMRLMWNNGKPLNFGSKWNPLCNDVPFSTFTSHPLFFHKDCNNEERKKLYDIEEFIENVCSNITDLKRQCNGNEENSCIIHHKDIVLDSYVGIGSLIHNRNALGFFKVRGRFSF